jgi:cell wall-associated NlpC family hydrolase
VSIGRKYRIRGLALAAISSTAIAGLMFVPGAANADPGPTLEQARKQVAELQHQAEVAGEAANDLRDDIAAARSRVNAVNNGIASQQKQVDAIRTQIGALAVANYQQSGMTTTAQLLLSRDPDQFLTQASTARAFAGQQNAVLQKFQTAQGRLTDLQAAAQTELAALNSVQAKQNDLKKKLQNNLDKAQAVLDKLSKAERDKLAAEQAAQEAVRTQRPSRDSTTSRPATPDVPASGSGRGAIALQYALNQLGDPYVWGADGPSSFDCSGLTMAAWRQAGVSLSHSSSAQAGEGRPVSRSQLQPGDLVFFYSPISHVGLYYGGGKVVHAPHPGASVEIAPISEMPYNGAVRPG